MLKRISVALVVFILAVSLVACSGPAPTELAGTWELVGARALGQTLTLNDLKSAGADVRLSFEFVNASRVKVIGSVDGSDSGGSAKYTFDGTTVVISDRSTTIELTLAGEQLEYSQAGVILLFERV